MPYPCNIICEMLHCCDCNKLSLKYLIDNCPLYNQQYSHQNRLRSQMSSHTEDSHSVHTVSSSVHMCWLDILEYEQVLQLIIPCDT